MEINKCLEDPNTVYSDQYMPLAMMPAVIEAIQQGGGGGGAKFGPYQLCITANKTIASGAETYLETGSAKNMSGNSVALPTDDKAHYFTVVNVGLQMEGLAITVCDSRYDFNSEISPAIYVRNVTNSSVTLDAGTPFMTVLSDVEFGVMED